MQLNNPNLKVLGGFLSPVSDFYHKQGLADGKSRFEMCKLATKDSNWIEVDDWEIRQPLWTRTVEVLRHFKRCVHEACLLDNITVIMVAGSDILHSFCIENLWTNSDLQAITTEFQLAVMERDGYNARDLFFKQDILFKNSRNVHLLQQYIKNNVSSASIRYFGKYPFYFLA